MPRVLVIDDNEDILGFLHEILSNSGYHSLRQAYTLTDRELLWRKLWGRLRHRSLTSGKLLTIR